MPMPLETEIRRRARAAALYLANRDRVLARSRARYQLHKESILRTYAERYKLQKDTINKRNLDYYRSHKAECHKRSMEWAASNPNKVAAYKRRWYLKNLDRETERHRRYQKDKPEIYVAAAQRRRALKAKAAVNLESIQAWMSDVRSKRFVVCYYCDKRFASRLTHFDHIVPLSKGGPHSVENLCVSCPKCNLTKHDKQVTAWIRIGQQVMSL